eukprot:TRINITY_DN6938_c0_g1_i1.p2 TRINITY_DN6938_c0_g1~~TRINITY_DN6938_c0_g1_i1.p2  ORF type:complete len:412 (+),score=78.13 TRINITY_DN6938_c0_g1_i1:42-1277(+)
MEGELKRSKIDADDDNNEAKSSFIPRKPNEGAGADSGMAGVFEGRIRKRRTGRLGASTVHDSSRERPLLTKLDRDFPVFNESKTTDKDKLPARVPTLEWGDRMKAIWDIEFLTTNTTPKSTTTVIYAGGYPGKHINVIASLFPSVEFICICEKAYEITLPKNVTQRLKRFDKHEAQIVKKRILESEKVTPEILFITDTWSAGCFVPGAVGETNILRDLLTQEEWFTVLSPKCASLRFWLSPVSYPRTQKYYGGSIYLPAWGSEDIKECRLFTTGGDLIEIDQLRFTRQVQFFNKIARSRKYVAFHPNHPTCTLPVQCEGMDWRFDASTEIATLLKYLRAFTDLPSDSAAAAGKVEDLSKEISSMLSNGEYTLATHPSRPGRKASSNNKPPPGTVKLNPTTAADRYLASLGM